MKTVQQAANLLMGQEKLAEGEIVLDLDGYKISVRSNSEELIEKLGIYFSHTLGTGPADIEIIAIDGPSPNLDVEFQEWKREPGKTGRKDAFYDLEDGRLILKVRTGMVFLQSETLLLCAGPSLENDNQVINYINAQYMNHLQHNGALICHASGLVSKNAALGIAGFSGGGKSTLMLHILAKSGISFLTNDRLFINEDMAIGVPKLPRINPGTILNDENLIDMLSPERQAELKALPLDELWHLEEKYDVWIEDIYGEHKIAPKGTLKNFLILNWKHDHKEPCTIKEVNIVERRDLLKAIMKSPGPFYQLKDGTFFMHKMELGEEPYLKALENVTIFEASGKVDFKYAQDFCLNNLLK